MCIDCILFRFLERWCCFQCVLSSRLECDNQGVCGVSVESAVLDAAPKAHVHCYVQWVFATCAVF